MILLGQL